MNCEICGEFEESLIKTEIEGAVINVCRNCSKYGRVLQSEKSIKNQEQLDLYENQLREDFSGIIRSEMEKRGMSSEELADKIKCSPKDINKIIKGTLMPDEQTVRKIERFLGLNLYEEESERSLKIIKKDENVSFGDIVEIKKKK